MKVSNGNLPHPLWYALISKQLNSIDNMRIDGKFMVGSDIPEGQGALNELLAECYDLVYQMRVESGESG